MASYIPMSAYGRSVLGNSILYNCFVGFEQNPLQSYIKQQISATAPVIYNSSTGNISINLSGFNSNGSVSVSDPLYSYITTPL